MSLQHFPNEKMATLPKVARQKVARVSSALLSKNSTAVSICVPQEKINHTGFEQHEGDFHDYPSQWYSVKILSSEMQEHLEKKYPPHS